MTTKARIAHLAGPNATIQNTPPLVTSNKARTKYGPRTPPQPRRIAAALRRSAHPEAGAACHSLRRAIQRPPPGTGRRRALRPTRRLPRRIQRLPPGTPLPPRTNPSTRSNSPPTTATTRCPTWRARPTAAPWEEECTDPKAPTERARQPFFPDGARSFAEIDQMAIGAEGVGNLISSLAEVDFHRIVPPAGYTAQGEQRGVDFFAYKPVHLENGPPKGALGADRQPHPEILDSNDYDGAIWTQGQPPHRGNPVLAEPAARHHEADLRERRAARARHDQQ